MTRIRGSIAIVLFTVVLGACSTSQTPSSASAPARTDTAGGSRAQTVSGTGGSTSISSTGVGSTGDARPFRRDGKYGIRNASGEVTIEPRYDIATLADTGRGLIVTQTGGKIGLVNGQGREITPPKYDSISTPKGDVYLVKAGGKSCAVDATGREFLPCVYDSIMMSSDPSQFYVMQDGKGRYVNRSGAEIRYQVASPQPASAPARTTANTATATTIGRIYTRAMSLAKARQWDNAIRAALNSTPQDKIDVLLTFRDSSTNDTQRWPGEKVVLENMRIFDDAIAAASPEQRRQLASMKQSFEDYIRSQGHAPTPSSGSPVWRSPSTSSPVGRAYTPPRCYQTSRGRQTCFN